MNHFDAIALSSSANSLTRDDNERILNRTCVLVSDLIPVCEHRPWAKGTMPCGSAPSPAGDKQPAGQGGSPRAQPDPPYSAPLPIPLSKPSVGAPSWRPSPRPAASAAPLMRMFGSCRLHLVRGRNGRQETKRWSISASPVMDGAFSDGTATWSPGPARPGRSMRARRAAGSGGSAPVRAALYIVIPVRAAQKSCLTSSPDRSIRPFPGKSHGTVLHSKLWG